MVATPERIGFVTKEFRIASATDSSVQADYSKAARDSGADPVETFFDSVDDAQAIADERLTLLSAERRRFRLKVQEVIEFTGDLDYTQSTPTATVIDTERAADFPAAIVELGVDFGADTTTLIVWG